MVLEDIHTYLKPGATTSQE